MTRPRAALIALFAVVLPAAADDPKLPGPKIEWPEVKGFTRGKTQVFPQTGLGYSISYDAPKLAVTAYVYDKRLPKIPDGVKSDVVKAEMKQAAADLELARKRGLYTAVKEVGKEEVVALGKGKDAPSALRRTFEIVRKGEDGAKLSELYVTGYKDHFVKLRITYDPEGKAEAEQAIAALLEALGGALQ
jgi:hypothetical protein